MTGNPDDYGSADNDAPRVIMRCVPRGSQREGPYRNLKYVGGDMFQSVPTADAILLKLVLHSLSDEECVKILKKCREAIPSKEEGGKVIVIDIVINEKKEEHDITEAKLLFDLLMMTLVTGRERNEKEWEKLLLEAGFSHYKINPIFGLRSLIEVFP